MAYIDTEHYDSKSLSIKLGIQGPTGSGNPCFTSYKKLNLYVGQTEIPVLALQWAIND